MSGHWQYGTPFPLSGMTDAKVFAKACEPRKIKFEKVNPHGWYVVLFPNVHDESQNVEVWLDKALSWLRSTEKLGYTWGLLHGVEKQDKEITSPVFYFKERYDALQCTWRLSGTLQGE